ncbi:MAG TPA: hypothetical protein VFQ53_25805 [Kofleriaceae bacterium]|nr:hypothetical protein [Kofleriaceae bacterium]
MSGRFARVIASACIVASGCDLLTDSFVTNDFSGDLQPIGVDTSSGAVIVGVREEGKNDRTAIVDVLSPFTLDDPGENITPFVRYTNWSVLGRDATDQLALSRALLRDARILTLHPCADAECFIGPGSAGRPFQAIIGADSLAGDALRLRLGDQQIFILADVAGGEQERGLACDAVYPSPYRGGGTLVIAGTELGFSGRRVTMPACLGFDPDIELPQSQRGADVLLLVSTAIGPSILGETAYERYREVRPTAPALDQLPDAIAFLPSGPITGKRATVDRVALVARSGSTPRAPCRHVFAHHLLLERDCVAGEDCPCEDGTTFCPLPGLVELTPSAGIDVLVVSDEDPTLQALRTELRPDQPEVDGILGTGALGGVELDIDYPHDRVLARCAGPGCATRPALPEKTDRARVAECLRRSMQ